jgi:hypothetical protein
LESKNIGATIHVKFKLPTDNIYYIITATGQESKTSAIEGNLRLIKGRIYYIPIDNTDINSDNYNKLIIYLYSRVEFSAFRKIGRININSFPT